MGVNYNFLHKPQHCPTPLPNFKKIYIQYLTHPPSPTAQATANRLRSLNTLPFQYNTQIPTQQTTIHPPSKLTPPPIPMRDLNIGLATNIAPKAKTLRLKLFALKILAAYLG